MKKLAFIVILFSFFGSIAQAQSRDGQASNGSVYSRLGVGYPVDIANTAAHSMGLEGVSFNDPFVGSLTNPAHWGNTIYGLGSGGIGIKSFQASDGINNATNSNFSINQFQLQLPIVRRKLGISGSFSPVTQSRFRTFEERSVTMGEGATGDSLRYGIESIGSGGINRAELGFGWNISENISVGYAGSIVFMSLDKSVSGSFSSPLYQPVNYVYETSGTGFGNRFGTQLRFPEPFGDKDLLEIGATVKLPVTIDAKRKKTTDSNLEFGNIQEPNLGNGTIKLPMTISGGITYHPNNKVMFSTETLYERWSAYRNDFKANSSVAFVDRYKWGLGFQYLPFVTGSNKFLSNFKYRLGTSYDSGQLRIKGERINTLMFSLGLGILAPRSSTSNSSIDLSFEYGIRGTENMNLVQEQIWGVRLSLNLAEIMFFRPKLQ